MQDLLPGVPPNLPDDAPEADGPDVLFAHGFNVAASEAAGWNADIFKRLWQSGHDMMKQAEKAGGIFNDSPQPQPYGFYAPNANDEMQNSTYWWTLGGNRTFDSSIHLISLPK